MAKKILIVEDEEGLQMMIEARLTANGYSVKIANNGVEGLKAVEAEVPDLIISDVLMPEMDGFQFFKTLQGNEATAKIPIIILTARGKMEDTFMAMGVEDFMAKPFKTEELLERIAKKIGKGDGEAVAAAPAAGSAAPEEKKEEKKEEIKEDKKPEPPPPPKPAPAPPPKTSALSLRIFVIGKSAGVIDNIQQQLSKINHQVIKFTKGQEALNQMEGVRPDLVLIETLLDDMESREVVKRLRKHRDFKQRPIVMFSYFDKNAVGDQNVHELKMKIETSRTHCIDAGANDAITQFAEADFINMIGKYLKQ